MAQASWARGLPWVASFQEQEGHSLTSRESLPCGVQASCQGKEDPGDPGSGEVGSWSLQEEEERRVDLEVSFLVEVQLLFPQSGSRSAPTPVSGISLQCSLCVSDRCRVFLIDHV